jgi:hypothetical protein
VDRLRLARINEVQITLAAKLRADTRFVGSKDLLGRFDREIAAWQRGGSFQAVIEIGNELAAAERLLSTLGRDGQMRYEPPIVGSKKRIDFLLLDANRTRSWVEVKTIHPTWVDNEPGWQRFVRIAQAFPANAQLVVDSQWAGSAIAGQSIKTRWSFIKRSVEVEARAAEISRHECGPVWLMLCSTGLNWCLDELEDFADFYRTGVARDDDWMCNAAAQYMRDEQVTFSGALAGFHYLARKHDAVSAHDFRCDVRGPAFGR